MSSPLKLSIKCAEGTVKFLIKKTSSDQFGV